MLFYEILTLQHDPGRGSREGMESELFELWLTQKIQHVLFRHHQFRILADSYLIIFLHNILGKVNDLIKEDRLRAERERESTSTRYHPTFLLSSFKGCCLDFKSLKPNLSFLVAVLQSHSILMWLRLAIGCQLRLCESVLEQELAVFPALAVKGGY